MKLWAAASTRLLRRTAGWRRLTCGLGTLRRAEDEQRKFTVRRVGELVPEEFTATGMPSSDTATLKAAAGEDPGETKWGAATCRSAWLFFNGRFRGHWESGALTSVLRVVSLRDASER